jgi:hypothetical protein
MNGLEAAPLLVKILPRVWLILLTLYEQPEVHRRAKIAGIHGMVFKGQSLNSPNPFITATLVRQN